jgi:hypothetical protein
MMLKSNTLCHQLQNLTLMPSRVSGDVFISKKSDKQKKRKIKKVEDKMLGWGNLCCCFW